MYVMMMVDVVMIGLLFTMQVFIHIYLYRPLLRVPTLAIHLDGSVNDAFKFNKENHLVPVLATAVKS